MSDQVATRADIGADTTADQSETVPSPAENISAVTFNDKIEILPSKRLPYLDKGPVKAYAARARGDSSGSTPYFAMICEKHLLPRMRSAAAYGGITNSTLVKITSFGSVFWPASKDWRYCFVYENTLGKPLMKSPDQEGMGLKQDSIMSVIVKPMANLFLDFRDMGFFHGNVRPQNLFDGGGSGVLERVVLGEALCTPPGYSQSAAYEPIERAMCDSVAKGTGTILDDLYALGVTLSFVLRKKDPFAGMDDKAIIREKIETGSYASLTGGEHFAGNIMELLRGLLYDDPSQRWSVEEVMQWLEGQHLSPRQNSRKKRASRSISFNNEKYFRPSLLAMDLNRDQAEAVQLIENGHIEQWISRSLEDVSIRKRYESAVEASQVGGRGPGYWDRLIARVSIALDPDSPLRFKGMNVHPEGFGYQMAESFLQKKDVQPFADVINQQLMMEWLTSQASARVDVGALISKFDTCRAYLRQGNNLGYGIERCLYYLAPESQCMSDRLKDYMVRAPEDLMGALEDMAAKPDRPELFIDRHIAAFLSVKDRRMIDAYWSELNAPEYFRRIRANVMVLATIQKRSKMEMFPGLTRWVAEMLDPVYERYHDRDLRKQVKDKIEKLKDSGDLTKIAFILDAGTVAQQDFEAFRYAMKEYQDLRKEYEKLEEKVKNPGSFGMGVGREIAAIASGVIAGIFILAFTFYYFISNGVF